MSAYIMRHEYYNRSPYKGMFITLARWCNQPSFLKKKSFRQFCEANGLTREMDPEAMVDEAHFMQMDGQAVFKFATSAMMRCTEEALTRAGLTTDDVTLFTPHQPTSASSATPPRRWAFPWSASRCPSPIAATRLPPASP